MKAFVWAGCLGMAMGTASAASAGAQTVVPPAPDGVQLKVLETAVDLSTPAFVTLHVQVVNGSPRPVSVWPGGNSLVSLDAEGTGRRCDNLPNLAARQDAAARTLRPGDTYSETVTLNTSVCRSLLMARAVQVERTVFTGAESQGSLRSQPLPVQNGRGEEDAIRALLAQQAADWNRGDLAAFATGYKDSPDILFIGRTLQRGYDAMLATYKQGYATREAMGMLTFADLQVQPLDMSFATVTGHFHLERTAAGGGNADGYFMLVAERTAGGWKIVRDDTTALPVATAAR